MSVTVRSVAGSVASCASELAKYEHCDLQSYLGSSQFLKAIVPFTVAGIITRRCAISPKYLNQFTVGSVPYVGFRSTVPDGHCVRFIHAAERKIQHVVYKKQLQAITLFIQRKSTQTIEEVYDIALDYLADDDPRRMKPKDTLAAGVAGAFFAQLQQIPNENMFDENEINIHFRLHFRQNAPPSTIADFDPFDLHFDSQFRITHIASLSTMYHNLNVSMKIPVEQAASPGRRSLRSRQSKASTPKRLPKKRTRNTAVADDNVEVIEIAPSSKSSRSDSFCEAIETWQFTLSTQFNVNQYACFCNVQLTIPIVDGIQCKNCKLFEHIPCIGYSSKANIANVDDHVCAKCLRKVGKWKDTILINRYKNETLRKYFCLARLFAVCNHLEGRNYILDYLADNERAAVVAFLIKKKLWCDDDTKASNDAISKMFYDQPTFLMTEPKKD